MEGFLTEEQRQLLSDAAQSLEPLKEMGGFYASNEHASKQATAFGRNHPVAPKQERRSHSASNGRPKKGGGGGRGTWGNPLDPNTDSPVDRNDPNYDSDEEPYKLHIAKAPVANMLDEYKEKVTVIIDQYFISGAVSEVAQDLRDLGFPNYHHYFVKRLISIALDRHDREKEMASSLLSALYVDVIQPESFVKGFMRLIETADDLEIDCPDAAEVLALFLARAIVDDILPPSFILRASEFLHENCAGTRVLEHANKHLQSPHHAERVERCWGGSGINTVDGAKSKITLLLEEYVAGGDMAEALRCIRDLNLPFFHHEVVKRALVMAMENKNAPSSLLSLLRETAEQGLITSSQMAKGFSRVADSVDDLALDIPAVRDLLHSFIAKATSEGWLSPALAKNVSAELSASELAVAETESKLFRELKQKAEVIIKEYFESGDLAEVARSLEELAYPDLLHLFVKKLVTLAMDRKNREREMASVLMSEMYEQGLPSDQIEIGFSRLLESVDDLALDIPDASAQLALFIVRAIADDILAPQFLSESNSNLHEGGLAAEVVHQATAVISARHGSERALRCWGGPAAPSLEDSKHKIDLLLQEYDCVGDISEACRCIRDLDMSFFHHEIVKKSLVMAMEKRNKKMLELLQECGNEGLITTNQMIKGFNRVAESLSDLSLDLPGAFELFDEYVATAKKGGWLSASFQIPALDTPTKHDS